MVKPVSRGACMVILVPWITSLPSSPGSRKPPIGGM